MVTAIRRHNGSGPRNTARQIITDIAATDTARDAVLGKPVKGWGGAAPPDPFPVDARYCRIEPLSMAHAPDLYAAFRADGGKANWVYLPYGPFDRPGSFRAFLAGSCPGGDPLYYAVRELASGRALGMVSYLRIDPPQGVIEVGHMHFSPALQRRPAATETMFLMVRQVFDDWGNRRYK